MANEAQIKIDRAEVMRRAWRFARDFHRFAAIQHIYSEDLKPAREPRLPYTGKLRDFFAEALRNAWQACKRDAVEAAAFAALPEDKQVAIKQAELAVLAAQGIDSTRAARPIIAAARAHLNKVRAA